MTPILYNRLAEAATGGILWKKVFLEILQNSQDNTGLKPVLYLKRGSGTCAFPWILRNF